MRRVLTAGPPRPAAGCLLLAGLVLAAALAWADPAGRVLGLPAALVLVGFGLRDLLLAPVLRAGPAGLDVVVGLRRRHVPWAQVAGLRVVSDRRTPLLELDLGDQLVVLTRWRLGRAPAAVLAELLAVRAA